MPARKTKKSTSATKTPSTEVAENTVVEQTTTVEETAPVVEETGPSMADDFNSVLAELASWRSTITALTAQVRALRTRSEREVKAAQKAGRKRKSNRKPSGFVKPTLISTELASFLGKPKGTEMARTEVTREINKYIRANNLQDPQNGRVIRADAKLRKLLKLNKSDELTYFNLQKYMSPHFPKPTATATSS